MNQNKKQNGFSFVEMIIVVSIVLLLTTYSFVSYRQNQHKYELKNSAERFVSALRRAQGLSQGGSVTPSGQTTDKRYGVVVTSATEYKIFRDMDGNNYYNQGDEVIEEESVLKNIAIFNIQNLQAPKQYSISFPVPGDFTSVSFFEDDIALNLNPLTFEFVSSKNSDISMVTINRQGIAQVQ